MKLAEIKINRSFAIHSALTLSRYSVFRLPDTDGWYVRILVFIQKLKHEWLKEGEKTARKRRCWRIGLVNPRFRAKDYKDDASQLQTRYT